jgi:hypothetical protein
MCDSHAVRKIPEEKQSDTDFVSLIDESWQGFLGANLAQAR